MSNQQGSFNQGKHDSQQGKGRSNDPAWNDVQRKNYDAGYNKGKKQ